MVPLCMWSFSPSLSASPGITVLLSLTVFMLLVAEIMPATSDSVPLIGRSHFHTDLKSIHLLFATNTVS